MSKYSLDPNLRFQASSLSDLFSEILWAGEDLNLRRLTPTGLQPVPFGRSGTDPEVRILALAVRVPTISGQKFLCFISPSF